MEADLTADLAALVRDVPLGGEAAKRAEASICRQFAPRIRLYGIRHLRSEDRAADLVQQVLLATLEAVRTGRVEDPSRFDRFILGTCRNTALRMREREGRYEPRPVEDFDVGLFEVAKEAIDVEALIQCIAALEERPRRVVQLTFHEERATDDIARALDLTVANVRVLRHRAVAQLRTCLDRKAAR